ncbi:hypothetical protein VY88_00235 [Azospirillum thiophilum]|uniref:YjiS-like domain-containing protein n=1 Tax=Azospirillum thiophilum TaxID=528244 RepID=A0AAC8VYJ0_9PROT|nr:DUF1127 domain-containing protein [Azospirillum thiophilum]ALG71600.1 hypothetical protein AL072_12475 [Azospirillum thiophilum]KJR64753.1 hypothetical protein VY88_00235 [Azospirillum thiophilum]
MAHGTQSSLSSATLSARTPVRSGTGMGDWLVSLFDRFATWSERRRQRRALEALPDHLLSDIGISRADAEQESHKPFWQG